MSIYEIYEDVLALVEKIYQRNLQALEMDAKDMIKEGVMPNDVNKMENQRSREHLLNFKAHIKIGLVVELFVKSNYTLSDAQIAQIISAARENNPEIPSLERSSVGRYLTDKRIGKLYGQEIYLTILQKRKENLMAAKSKGGKAFAQNNVAVKDELGHFQGSQKR